MAETKVTAALIMDRSEPLGNSPDTDGRRRLHTKITNSVSEPVYSDLRPLLSARVTIVSVNANAWTKLPPTNLANRHSITVQNTDANKILYINYTNTVPLRQGFEIYPQSSKELLLADSVQMYGCMESNATANIAVEEVGQ